jgi:hypothetical protein
VPLLEIEGGEKLPKREEVAPSFNIIIRAKK